MLKINCVEQVGSFCTIKRKAYVQPTQCNYVFRMDFKIHNDDLSREYKKAGICNGTPTSFLRGRSFVL
jgi:hypothetical protein